MAPDPRLTENELFDAYRHATGPTAREETMPKLTPTRSRVLDELIFVEALARHGPPRRTPGRTLQLYRVAAGVSALAVATKMHRTAQSLSQVEQRGADGDVAGEYIDAVDFCADVSVQDRAALRPW